MSLCIFMIYLYYGRIAFVGVSEPIVIFEFNMYWNEWHDGFGAYLIKVEVERKNIQFHLDRWIMSFAWSNS